MSLESRLSRLRAQAGADTPAASDKPAQSTLRTRLAQLQSRGRTTGQHRSNSTSSPALPVEALADRLKGECIAEGVIRIRQRVPLTGKLGAVELTALHDKPCLPGEPGRSCRNVYIDTETTGLSGGSGTLAFLIGVATVERDAIELTQWLMIRFAAEATVLSAFANALTAADRLVSYNGKSYDLPLLHSRFRMQGLQPAFENLPHLDLATRSLFLIAGYVPLTPEETQAIRYHDGYVAENRGVAHRETPLTRLVQYADNWCGGVVEARGARRPPSGNGRRAG